MGGEETRRGLCLCLFAAVVGLAPGIAHSGAPGEVAAWGAATAGNRCQDYQGFLARFPDGQLATLAAKRVAALCQPAPSAAAPAPAGGPLPAPPERTPAGAVANPAPRPPPSAAEVERAAWSAAARKGSCAAFARYLKSHPQGAHAGEARARLAACRQPAEHPPAAAAGPSGTQSAPAPAAAVGRSEAESLVARLMAASNAADAGAVAALYVDRPDYYGHSRVDRAYVRADKRRFFDRWPQVAYRLLGPIQVDTLGNGDAAARFQVAFEVYDPARGTGISGAAENWLTIGREGGAVRIRSIGEKVLSRQQR